MRAALLVVDIGSPSGKESPLVYAEDENNLVYVIVPTPSQSRQIETHPRPNLRVFCLTLGDVDACGRLLALAGLPSPEVDAFAPALDLAVFMAQGHERLQYLYTRGANL